MPRILCNLIPASSSYYSMASDVIFTGDFDITFKFWTRGADDEIIIGNNNNSQNFIACISGGVFRIRLNNFNINSASGVIEKSKYYTGRITRVGTTVTGYLDGVIVLSGITSNTITFNSIGSYNVGSLTFNGYLADIDLGTDANSWVLDTATGTTEDSIGTGNIITYTNIAESERFIFTENSGLQYWWGPNGDNLELDVQQPAADVYLLAGQSNMIGRANIVSGIDDVYSTLNGRIMSFGYNSQARFGAQNPLDHFDEISTDMGCWREMCLGLSASNVLLVPTAKGGSAFVNNNWNQGDAIYASAVASMNAGMLSNSANSLKAMIWLQGETDADTNVIEATYLANLQAMRTAMITDVTDMTVDTPWIVIEIGTLLGTYAQINSALASFITSIPNGTLITKDGLVLEDIYHYDPASLRSIGTQVGAAAQAFLTAPSGAASDAKLAKLEAALVKIGHVNDLEIEWLQSLHASVTSNCLMDAWAEYFDSQSIAAGQLDDRAYAWLGGLGHTGSLSDRWLSYWSS